MINVEHMKERRKQNGMTQAQLAERVSLSKDHIWKIEHGRVSPQLSTIAALCLALDTDPNKLLGWE